MSKFDTIFLDLDHTLVDTRLQYKLGLEHTIAELYDNKVPKNWTLRFMANHQELWAQYDRREITMPVLRRERFLRAWRDFGVEKPEQEANEFQAVYDANFDKTLFPYPETNDLIADLARDHRLGIITNGSPDLQERKLAAVGLLSYFPKNMVTVSEYIGLAKPHPSVYAAACQSAGVEPRDAVMIGDNYRADVAGAESFGMPAIWYVPDMDMARAAEQGEGRRPLTTRTEVLEALRRMENDRHFV